MADIHSIASTPTTSPDFCVPLPPRVRGVFAEELARRINARGTVRGRDLAAFCDEEGELWLIEDGDDCERIFRQPGRDEAARLAAELGAKPARLAHRAA